MAWRNWLLRATAGDVTKLQIMYGPAGERRLAEWEIDWLPGYEGSTPVRVGNAAAGQFQLDVYGEVMSALFSAASKSGVTSQAAWDLQTALLSFVEQHWQDPDEGIWEVRGPRRHFTHSKVMAWVAVDRADPHHRGVARPRGPARRLAGPARSGSTTRSATRGTTTNGGPSPSTTGRISWTPACS